MPSENSIQDVFTLGRHNHLVAIMERPCLLERQQLVVMINAGLVPHVGPFRMHVDLSRALVDQGIASLRFDLSGIGDSQWPINAAVGVEQHLQDMDDLTAWIQQNFPDYSVWVFGSCTGADYAHQVLCHHALFVGGIFLDGYAYPTFGFHARKIADLLKSPSRLIAAIGRRCLQPLTRKKVESHADLNLETQSFTWTLPPKTETEQDYQDWLNRNLFWLNVFSGGAHDYFRYSHQIYDAFPKLALQERCEIIHLPRADHLYTRVLDRKMVIEMIVDWMINRCPEVVKL
ncbi:MAG: alpha/beta hydrolase [Pseudomonadota bacterium]